MSTDFNSGERLEEQPVAIFQVITDTHVTSDSQHTHNCNLDRAFKDIIANGHGSIGIMHAGDVTDHGFEAEYAELHRIVADNREDLPKLLYTCGNHDVGLGDWEDRISRYSGETGMSGPYHDHWLGGYHFIFLGTERGLEKFCDLSVTQLAWFEDKLAERASSDRPIFVFLHQPLMDTVGGSFKEQDWYGVTQDQELRGILNRYPQVVMFTGHTHWELEASYAMAERKPGQPAMFNASSVGYLWTDEDAHKVGSQGYYVEIYKDSVLVRGRDFTSGEWIESARFRVDFSNVME